MVNNESKKDFARTQSELMLAEEELHRMIQGNIAVLNGQNISKVLNEFRKWLTSYVIKGTTDDEENEGA